MEPIDTVQCCRRSLVTIDMVKSSPGNLLLSGLHCRRIAINSASIMRRSATRMYGCGIERLASIWFCHERIFSSTRRSIGHMYM